MSLRARLTVSTACILAVAICGGFLAAYFVVRGQLRREIDVAIEERAAAFIALGQVSPNLPVPNLGRNARVPSPKLGGAGGYAQFVDVTGKTSLPPGETLRLPAAGATEVAAGKRGAFFHDERVAGTHLRIYTTRVNSKTAVEIARPLSEVDHSLSRIRLLFLAISLAAVACAALGGLLVARTTLRPVKQLTDGAERIAATGDLHERTDASRSDELGRLAVAFNTMLDALSNSVTAQRQLVADASHELATPLATARTNLEVLELHQGLPAGDRARILSEAVVELKEMTRLIDDLVQLARGDVRAPVTEPTRLDLIVEEVIATASRRSGIAFAAVLEPTFVTGNPAALASAITNMIDNAAKWSPPGGKIEINVRAGTVAVRDHGPGIDPADLPHVFDRFYRAAAARTMPGSGLGLAIVRQVASSHSGSVSAELAPGGGTRLTLRIPPRADEHDNGEQR